LNVFEAPVLYKAEAIEEIPYSSHFSDLYASRESKYIHELNAKVKTYNILMAKMEGNITTYPDWVLVLILMTQQRPAREYGEDGIAKDEKYQSELIASSVFTRLANKLKIPKDIAKLKHRQLYKVPYWHIYAWNNFYKGLVKHSMPHYP
jgi:hypothetical protein